MKVKELREFIADLPDEMIVCIAMDDNGKIRDTDDIYPLIGHNDEFLMIMEDWANR